MKKYITYGLIALLIWWVAQDPLSAAHLVHGIGGMFTRLAGSLSTIANGS